MNPVSFQLPSLPSGLDSLVPTKTSALASDGALSPFTDLLTSGIQDVNTQQLDANAAVHELLTGGDVNRVEVLTSVQKADMSFRLMQQIRNKLVDAYREINQMSM